MDPLAVLAYGAEQALPLIGMEWNEWRVMAFSIFSNMAAGRHFEF